jgi:hypothetical protein
MKAFVANRREANNVVREASLLAGPILQLAAKGTWLGTAEQLLRLLDTSVPESARQPGSDQDHPDRASGTDRCVRRSWRDGETELTSQSRGARTAASTR